MKTCSRRCTPSFEILETQASTMKERDSLRKMKITEAVHVSSADDQEKAVAFLLAFLLPHVRGL